MKNLRPILAIIPFVVLDLGLVMFSFHVYSDGIQSLMALVLSLLCIVQVLSSFPLGFMIWTCHFTKITSVLIYLIFRNLLTVSIYALSIFLYVTYPDNIYMKILFGLDTVQTIVCAVCSVFIIHLMKATTTIISSTPLLSENNA